MSYRMFSNILCGPLYCNQPLAVTNNTKKFRTEPRQCILQFPNSSYHNIFKNRQKSGLKPIYNDTAPKPEEYSTQRVLTPLPFL